MYLIKIGVRMNLTTFIDLAAHYDCHEISAYEKDSDIHLKDDNLGFLLSWSKGGEGGNSCWGGDSYRIDEEGEPYFENVREFIQSIMPALDANTIYTIINELTVNWEYKDDSDYYGNYENFGLKFISVKKLYKKLVIDLEFKALNEMVEVKKDNKLKLL